MSRCAVTPGTYNVVKTAGLTLNTENKHVGLGWQIVDALICCYSDFGAKFIVLTMRWIRLVKYCRTILLEIADPV